MTKSTETDSTLALLNRPRQCDTIAATMEAGDEHRDSAGEVYEYPYSEGLMERAASVAYEFWQNVDGVDEDILRDIFSRQVEILQERERFENRRTVEIVVQAWHWSRSRTLEMALSDKDAEERLRNVDDWFCEQYPSMIGLIRRGEAEPDYLREFCFAQFAPPPSTADFLGKIAATH